MKYWLGNLSRCFVQFIQIMWHNNISLKHSENDVHMATMYIRIWILKEIIMYKMTLINQISLHSFYNGYMPSITLLTLHPITNFRNDHEFLLQQSRPSCYSWKATGVKSYWMISHETRKWRDLTPRDDAYPCSSVTLSCRVVSF